MKGFASNFSALFLVLFLISSMAFAQEGNNLTGTWEGATWVAGPEIELVLTLVLVHDKDKITGKINDDAGYINCEITEVKLEKNVFTFNAVANAPDGDVIMTFELKVAGDKIDGQWTTEGGFSGTWTPQRKKAKEVN